MANTVQAKSVMLGLLALIGLGIFPAITQAQPKAVAPGLWESTLTNPEMASAMAQMNAEMAKMPPAQRAQMEKMMSANGGGMGKNGATRVCLTPEMVKTDPSASMARPGCTHKMSWSGNTAQMEFSCQNGEKGRGEFVYASDKAYSGWIEAQGKSIKPARMTIESKWVGADCGEVKPIKR